jgi:hypothetical protein
MKKLESLSEAQFAPLAEDEAAQVKGGMIATATQTFAADYVNGVFVGYGRDEDEQAEAATVA